MVISRQSLPVAGVQMTAFNGAVTLECQTAGIRHDIPSRHVIQTRATCSFPFPFVLNAGCHCDMFDNSHIYLYLYYLYNLFIYYISYLFLSNIFYIYNIYLQHIHYESAYMYTVGWDAGRISIYVSHNNKRRVLPHPLICIMLSSTP